MLYKIHPSQLSQFPALLAPLDEHLCVTALVQGTSTGQVYLDDPRSPQALFIDMGVRLFLSGAPRRPEFLIQLNTLLHHTVPQDKAAGRDAFILHATTGWVEHIPAILAGLDPHEYPRQYYELTTAPGDWRPVLPAGFTMLPVNRDLLQRGYANTIELRQEMCSERPSVEDFLARSFGFCVLHQNALVAWCLSEYNSAERCEVGIATHPDFQRRGLGLAVALAMAEHAFAHGCRRIGWHCWKNNRPSALLAERAGYHLAAEAPVWVCFWDAKPVHQTPC